MHKIRECNKREQDIEKVQNGKIDKITCHPPDLFRTLSSGIPMNQIVDYILQLHCGTGLELILKKEAAIHKINVMTGTSITSR